MSRPEGTYEPPTPLAQFGTLFVNLALSLLVLLAPVSFKLYSNDLERRIGRVQQALEELRAQLNELHPQALVVQKYKTLDRTLTQKLRAEHDKRALLKAQKESLKRRKR